MKCTKCGQELKKEDRFCPACGSKVEAESYENKCNKCGRVLNSEDIFCPNCGEKNRQNYLLDKIHRYIEGNMDAFSDIYNETYSDIKAVCYAKFAGQPEEVDDMVQNSYIRIANKMYTYDASKGQFLAWARRVAANECNAELRKNKVKVTHIEDMKIDADDDKVVEFEDDHWEFNPEAHYAKTEREQMINEIISKIPEKQRECIVLYCMEQMKEEEIAEILEIPKGTVKSRIFNARKNIMAEVEDMKKRGINLFGMAPVVFFAWLLVSKKEAFAAEADAGAMYKKIKDQSKEKTNDRKETTQKEKLQHTAQKGSLETAGKAAIGATGKGIVAKVVAGIVAVAVIGTGGYIGYTKYQKNQSDKGRQEETLKRNAKNETVKDNLDDVLHMKKIEDKTYTTGIKGESAEKISLEKYNIESGYFNAKEADLDHDGKKELLVIKNNGLKNISQDSKNYREYYADENGFPALELEFQVYEKKQKKWKLADKAKKYLNEYYWIKHSNNIFLSKSKEIFIESYHPASFQGESGWNICGYKYENEKLEPIYFEEYYNSEAISGGGTTRDKEITKDIEIVENGYDFEQYPEEEEAFSKCMKKYGMDVSEWKYINENGKSMDLYKSVPDIQLLFSEETTFEKTDDEIYNIWTKYQDGTVTSEELSKEVGNIKIAINTSGKISEEEEESTDNNMSANSTTTEDSSLNNSDSSDNNMSADEGSSSNNASTSDNSANNNVFTDEQMKYIREQLKIPDSIEMEVTVGEPHLKDVTYCTVAYVEFHEKNGDGYAMADVDVNTAELVDQILCYPASFTSW